MKNTRKVGNIHFGKFFKAINVADIYEYILDLEATTAAGLQPGTYAVELMNLLYYVSK